MKSQAAEQEKKKAEEERKRKEDDERRKRERDARRKADLERQEQEQLAAKRDIAEQLLKQKQKLETASRTEKAYIHPSIKFLDASRFKGGLDEIPVEFLKGILFLFEGKVNWDKDKHVMLGILKNHLSDTRNVSRLAYSVKKIIL